MDDTQANDISNLSHDSSDFPDISQEAHVEQPGHEERSVFSSFAGDKSFEENVGLSIGLGLRPISESPKDEGLRLFSSFLKPDDTSLNTSETSGDVPEADNHAEDIPFFSMSDGAPSDSGSANPDTVSDQNSESVFESSPDITNSNPFVPSVEESMSKDPELDQLSDQAFPLFLRFKASDNISSVADAIREKSHRSIQNPNTVEDFSSHFDQPDDQAAMDDVVQNNDPIDLPGSEEMPSHADVNTSNGTVNETALHDFSLDDLNEFDLDQEAFSRPIFKPAPAQVTEPAVESESLNIPDVFQQRADPDIVVSADTEAFMPVEPISEELPGDSGIYEDAEVPLFIPLKQINPPNDTPSADSNAMPEESAAPDSIPVFAPLKAERPGSIDSHPDQPNERPGSKEYHPHQEKPSTRPGTQDTSKSSSHKSTKSSASTRANSAASRDSVDSVSSAERLISNRYTAAQQMGTIAPLPQREVKSRRRSGTRAPVIIALLTVVLIIGLVALWSFLDLGSVIFGNNTAGDASIGSSTITVTTATQTEKEETPSTATTAAPTSEQSTSQSSAETTAKEAETTTVPTTSASTKSTTSAATETTTEATTTTTTQESSGGSDKVPAWFSATITNGTSDQDTAIFDLNFQNNGSSAVSLYSGLRQVTLTFLTDVEIQSLTSDSFTFTAKEGKTNVFVGVPTNKENIEPGKILTTTIYGKSSGASVGKYKVKFYLEYYE